MKAVFVLVLVAVMAALSMARKIEGPDLPKCGRCDLKSCKRPEGCGAGQVKDQCSCCDVCGKAEYELCHHEKVGSKEGVFLGRCGDNLQCRVRDDLDDEPLESICYCKIEGALCGSDNHTYENLCHLMAQGIKLGRKVVVSSEGACPELPQILSTPDHVRNQSGSSVAMVCEARGYPIPTIEWTWTRVDGRVIYLPSDDLRVSINMRGGPERWQVTGWLQIMDLQDEHEGDYTCVAQNKNGMAEATARINVEDEIDIQEKMRKNKRKY